MAKRRDLREAVVQFLYFWEIAKPETVDMEQSMTTLWDAFELPSDGIEFCKALIIGVLQNKETLDAKLKEKLENWDISRVHKVDLTILRLALYEFYYRPDIPPVVTMNEAIDLAKSFSNEESGKFINGILDKVAVTLGRSMREGVK